MIQIVPALPPVASGVGDYAVGVASKMREEFGLESLFVVASERREYDEVRLDGFHARWLPQRSAQQLAQMLGESGDKEVLLQLSGYGYSRSGCPFWLLEGLKQWKQRQPQARLVTMFHELYATSAPWRKAFWFTAAQKIVIGAIARLSDVAVTNIDLYRCRLERWNVWKKGKIAVLSMPSNVGELSAAGRVKARQRSIVVFGLPASRRPCYDRHLQALKAACEQMRISQVHDVGPPCHCIPEWIGRARVIQHGRIEGRELNSLLSQSLAGFLDYSPAYMGKSGVFAAYCAHAMLPVSPRQGDSEDDGIRCGVTYYSPTAPAIHLDERAMQAVADAAWQWYQGHSLLSHARVFARALREGELAGASAAGGPK
jgi:hypothetical protein